MGLLDSITGSLGLGGENPLMKAVTDLITNSGGLSGLLQKFHEHGLGYLADSWVGTGQKLPLSPDQLQSVLGSDQIQQLAAKVGMDPETLSAKLAEILPQVVDKATPNGSVPDASSLQQSLGKMLHGIFGRE